MKLLRKLSLFCIGGGAYLLLEILWRGWTHASMFLAGGTAFLLIGQQGRINAPFGRVVRGILGALMITLVELGAGLLFNRSYGVWDYRSQPGNLWGQICPGYTILWFPVAMAADFLYAKLDAMFPGES